MKSIVFILAIILSINATAQSLKSHEVDDFTGIETKTCNWESAGKLNILVMTSKDGEKETIALLAYTNNNLGCSGVDVNYVIFLFEDGSTLKLSNDKSRVKCHDTAISSYELSSSYVKALTTKRMSKVRFSQDDGTYDTEIDATLLRRMLSVIDIY